MCMPPILVETTVRLGYAIFTVATLSFIGFGIQPPSADWGLAISDSYGLIDGGYLVDGAVRRLRHRLPGRRRQSRGRWRAGRLRDMSAPARLTAQSPDALTVSDLERRPIGCADATARCCASSASASGAARPMGWSANPAAANRPRHSPPCAICRATAGCAAGSILVDGRDLLALGEAELRQLRANTVSMVYQDPGRALNPSLRIGRQMAEVFAPARASARPKRLRPGRRDAAAACASPIRGR